MNKASLALLERAFTAEIDAALNGGIELIQTKSKLAATLVDEGYLIKETRKLRGRFSVTVEGYRLTEFGRFTYCMNCKG